VETSPFDPSRWTHRIGVHAMYYKIACDQAKTYQEREVEFSRLEHELGSTDDLSETARQMEQCYEQREQAAIIAITFSAMSLEAFLYDYAAQSIGDQFVQDHLDKLDLKSKFLLFPRLVCGKMPTKSSSAYEGLRKLISLRNELVHFKSRSFPLVDLNKVADFHDDLKERLRLGVDAAVRSVVLVLTELGNLHGNPEIFTRLMTWSTE
jgi:hypothetical protein